MPPRTRFAPFLIALSLLVPALARAELADLETKDLRLLYNAPALSFIAPYTARCFENSLHFHERLFHYTPSEKVNVILDDLGDYGNAGVWVNPRNSMVVHIAPVNFVYETGPSNERINFTMNHEVVHVVALDKAAGADRIFRSLFHGKVRETSRHPETMLYGYLTLPRRAAPRWYHEGIAVFMETWMAGGLGRAQGPYDEMVFRSMVRDSSRFYDPLGLEAEGVKVDFQVGVNSYLYGTRFMSYLAWTYGPDRVISWVSREPGSKRYFASQFRHVFGTSLDDGWRDWVAFEREFQQANLDSIRLHPTTPYRDIAARALGSVSRAFVDSTTRSLLAAVYYPGEVAHLAAIPLDGGPMRGLGEVKGPALYFVSSLAFDPASRTLYYTTDNNDWRDLCALDLATGKTRRLQRDARVGDLAWNSADRSLWGIRHFNGISSLVRIPPPYTDYQRLVSWPFGTDLYDLDISPDGKRLVASMAEISGRQTLRLYPTDALARGDSASTVLYDFGASIPTSFVFSPDGSRLYGSSYYTGVSNVFRYDFDGDSMSVVTNGETGFFRPVPTGSDSTIVFRYTGAGFVPAWIEARPLTDVSAITYLGQALVEKYPVLRTWIAPSPATVPIDSLETYDGPYHALRHVGLATVYPIAEGYKEHTTVGLEANFSDPVSLHALSVSASVAPDRKLPADERWHLALTYKHLGWTAGARYNPASFYDLVGPTKVSRKGYGANVGYERALLDDAPKHLALNAGVSGYGGIERLPDYQNVATSPGFDKLLSGDVSLHYKNMRASIGAVDYEKGWQWTLGASENGVRFVRSGTAAWRGYPLAQGTLDLGTPLPIRNSSLWLRNAAGFSPGDRNEPFANFYFGGFGNNWVDHQEPKRYRDAESFPGAELNSIAGRNYTKTMLDWNLPPVRFRRVGALPLYATWMRTSLFASGLVTNLDDTASRTTVGNVGAQADIRFQLLTQQPLTLSFGYARAAARHGTATDEWMVSLKLL
ncbi:MAG: TolB family protein [Hyphomicrobiales bacterium]